MLGYIKSPMNYTGGKYKLLPYILPSFPGELSRFVDLFAGGLNVGINVQADVIYANGDRRFYGPTRKETGERCLTCPYKNT